MYCTAQILQEREPVAQLMHMKIREMNPNEVSKVTKFNNSDSLKDGFRFSYSFYNAQFNAADKPKGFNGRIFPLDQVQSP
jgi:hypothetical protein